MGSSWAYPYLLQHCKQAGRDAESAKRGAGLGLAIAKKILELHDQTIQVQSRLHEGMAFV